MTALTLKALTAEVKAAEITKDSRTGLNQLLKLAKGHLAVVAAYDKGDAADALVKAFKVGALNEDYKGEGRAMHQGDAERLVAKVEVLLAEAKTAFATYWAKGAQNA